MSEETDPPDINDRELVVTRVLHGPRDRVFEAWTDPTLVSRWWGPEGFRTTTHRQELRPGGCWQFTMHGPDGRAFRNRIDYLRVEAPSLLEYRHQDEGEEEPVRFLARVSFADLGERTLLTLRMIFDDPQDLARVEAAYGASEGLVETMGRFVREWTALDLTAELGSPHSDRELACLRALSATPEAVFAAFSDPERLAAFWGPKGFRNEFHHFAFAPGGEWTLTMIDPDGTEYPNAMRFLVIEPDERLVIHHSDQPEFHLDIRFEASGSGCRLGWRQVFVDAATRERIEVYAGNGNEELLDRLEQVLAKTV